uniref:Uncharacterized protein n=1 Tax=Panagrolaimus davidi TaxID=227884 RepID=A0A914Q3T5_9BILA
MTIKIKLIFIYGLIYVGNGCLQNGVSNKCNCDGQRSCRYCSNNLYSTDGLLDSNQLKQYSSSYPPSTSLRRKEPEHEQSQLQQLPRPTSSESLQQYPPPDNIYLPDSSLSNSEDNVESTTTTTLYPSQEYANMIYGNNFYYKQQNSDFEESDSPLSRPLTSEFQTNQNTIIDNDSYLKIPTNSDNQIPYQKLEILERPISSPYSPPPPPFEVPSNKNTFSPIEDNTTISDQIPFEKYEIEPRPASTFPKDLPPSSPAKATEPKKPDSFNPLLVISPAISGSGLGVGILSFFKPNPVEIEVKMNSLRKHFELYLNEPNQFHTNSFKNICLDTSYNPIKLMRVLLYGHCEAVVNGPGDEAERTKLAENLEQNFNVLLDDLNEKRLNMSNTAENSTSEDVRII